LTTSSAGTIPDSVSAREANTLNSTVRGNGVEPVAIAVALVMTPAAYHRQAEPEAISERFISLSTKVLALSMVPSMLGVSLDFYIIARLILDSWEGSLILSSLLVLLFFCLWFVLPRNRSLQNLLRR
jgi:hypothetical protein